MRLFLALLCLLWPATAFAASSDPAVLSLSISSAGAVTGALWGHHDSTSANPSAAGAGCAPTNSGNGNVKMAQGGRLSHCYLYDGGASSTALTNGTVVTVYKNNVATALTVTAGGAKVTTSNTATTLDYAAGDILSVCSNVAAGTTTVGAALDCMVTPNGSSTGGHDGILVDGPGLFTNFTSPSTGTFGNYGDAHNTNGNNLKATAGVVLGSTIVPFAATFNGIGISLNSSVTGSEGVTAYDQSMAAQSDLTAAAANPATSAFSSTCTTHCAAAAGDRIAVITNPGNAGNKYVIHELETGGGQFVTATMEGISATFPRCAGAAYTNVACTQPSDHWEAAPYTGQFERLYVIFTAPPTLAVTVELCQAPAASPSAETCPGLKCTVGTSSTFCTDTTDTMSVAAGDLWHFKVDDPGGSIAGNNVQMSVQYALGASTPTPTWTAAAPQLNGNTPTPTPTNTAGPSPTPTDTATLTPTDTWTPSDVQVNGQTPTDSPTGTVTDTPTSTPTSTPTATLTDTPMTPAGVCIPAAPTATVAPAQINEQTATPTDTWTPAEPQVNMQTVTPTPTQTPVGGCFLNFQTHTGDLGQTCLYAGPYNFTGCSVTINAVFLGNGAAVDFVFATNPVLTFHGTVQTATTATVQSYQIDGQPPVTVTGGTAALTDGFLGPGTVKNGVLSIGFRTAPDMGICTNTHGCLDPQLCTFTGYVGDFVTPVSATVPIPTGTIGYAPVPQQKHPTQAPTPPEGP